MQEEYLLSLLLYCNIYKITILIGEVWESAIKVHIYLHSDQCVSVFCIFVTIYFDFAYFDKHLFKWTFDSKPYICDLCDN